MTLKIKKESKPVIHLDVMPKGLVIVTDDMMLIGKKEREGKG